MESQTKNNVNVSDWSLILQSLLEDIQLGLMQIFQSENPRAVDIESYKESLSLFMDEVISVLKSDRMVQIKAIPDSKWSEYIIRSSICIESYDVWNFQSCETFRFVGKSVTLRSIQSIEIMEEDNARSTD